MHSLFSKRGLLLGGLLALTLAAVAPSVAVAKPEPGVKSRGFRLFARATGAMTINRIYCGLSSTGEVCVDSLGSSTIGGGYWPKGTADQYVFNSGLQLAGIIGGSEATNPWANDTTGAYFFNPRGDNDHGNQVFPIFNAQSADDAANWPAAGLVPQGDVGEELFNPLLRGRVSASQGDVWFMSWEGNPASNGGRSHPLGIVVESRGLGWNFPAGNEDILYFIYTFYNITSVNEADYAGVRPAMRDVLMSQATQFQSLNEAAFGVTLPDEGYPINNLFAAFAADMDVAEASTNYSSVVLPFAMGHTYDSKFSKPEGWSFDPSIFAPPFFEGSGFIGVKYLKSPTGAGEIQLFSNTGNGTGFVNDSRETKQLYRYLSGTLSPSTGDTPCNVSPALITHVCFVNNTDDGDMRFFQSSTPLDLAPGAFGSIVVAYIFAAPYKPGSYIPGTEVKPGTNQASDVLRTNTVASLNNPAIGANMIDSIAGLLSFADVGPNGVPDGKPQQNEFTVVPGSLLGKALVAQAVFDAQFLLPFAPDAPEFFLVPGDDQVTVLWRPSPSEQAGDPYFQLASQATVIPPGGGAPEPNALYDPNYRQLDVEGYRVYRGRVDSPNSLTLLAQFDYGGTSILDFSAAVNPILNCAPELGIFEGCDGVPASETAYIPAEFVPGVVRTVSAEVPLAGQLIQITTAPSGRAELAPTLAGRTAIITKADTALTGGATGFPTLDDTGVPFVFVDQGVRNNFRYFYAVTAFDVNSRQSGPSSIESPRIAKPVTPGVGATNAEFSVTETNEVWGRGVQLTDNVTPTLDPATGTFSKAFPPANGWTASFSGYVAQVVKGVGSVAIRLDSIEPGSAYTGTGVAGTHYLTIQPGLPSESQVSFALVQDPTNVTNTGTANFSGAPVDPGEATKFGVAPDFVLGASVTATDPGAYYMSVLGRGCVNAAPGVSNVIGFFNAAGENKCSYNGSRWFSGPNETAPHPTAGNRAINDFANVPTTMPTYNNAGVLPGVTTIYEARSYLTAPNVYRGTEGIIGHAKRAADIKVYWGAAGVVDSVVDVTHNVIVPFDTAARGGWGIMNASNSSGVGSRDGRPAVVSLFDFGCVHPLRVFAASGAGSGHLQCTSPDGFKLTNVAELSPVAMISGADFGVPAATGKAPQPNPGFGMYLPGHIFFFEMPALPEDGAVWTMRSYTGGGLIGGATGQAGDEGPYLYTQAEVRPFTALGAEMHLVFDATNAQLNPEIADLENVHTVPDPYYVTSEFEQTTDNKVIKFVNLPAAAIIRIYSSSGVLIDVIEHNSITSEGSATWDVRNRNNQVVASGVYFYHVEAGDARRVGRFTVVNFAQ